MISCFSINAREYSQRFFSCHLSVDQQDLFNPAQLLPFSLGIDIALAFNKENGNYLAQKIILREQVNNTTPDGYDIESFVGIVDVRTNHFSAVPQISLKFKRGEVLRDFLAMLGSYRAVDKSFTSFQTREHGITERSVSQYHFEDKYDGLSYHFLLDCGDRDSDSSYIELKDDIDFYDEIHTVYLNNNLTVDRNTNLTIQHGDFLGIPTKLVNSFCQLTSERGSLKKGERLTILGTHSTRVDHLTDYIPNFIDKYHHLKATMIEVELSDQDVKLTCFYINNYVVKKNRYTDIDLAEILKDLDQIIHFEY